MHTTKQNLCNGKGSLKLIWALLLAIACIGTLALVSCPDDPDNDSAGKLDITSSETADLKWGDTVTYTLKEDGKPVTTDIEWSVTRDSVAAAEVPAVAHDDETLNLSDLITQENGVLTIDYRFITDAEAFGTTSYVIAAVYGAKTVTHTTSLKGIYIDITMVAKDAKSFTLDLNPVPFLSLMSKSLTKTQIRFGFGISTSNLIFYARKDGDSIKTVLGDSVDIKYDGLSVAREDTFIGTLNTGALARVKVSNTDGSDLTDPVVLRFDIYSFGGYDFQGRVAVEFYPSTISIGQSASFAMIRLNNHTAVFNAETSGYIIPEPLVDPAGEGTGK